MKINLPGNKELVIMIMTNPLDVAVMFGEQCPKGDCVDDKMKGHQ